MTEVWLDTSRSPQFRQLISVLTNNSANFSRAGSSTRFFPRPLPLRRWDLLARDPTYFFLVELTELIPRVEPAMLDDIYFVRLGPYPFVFTGTNIWTVEDLITSLRHRLTQMAAVEAAAIGRLIYLNGGTVHLTCAGWGEEDAGWDSDELPDLIDAWEL
ncbi:hypothetical protein B0H10DRAFT_2194899 [Mycena sp. CBHHK59/15]|nr:hypothetical protein B0H10DRAFT_2194899 [Mycena sp. CBHHK59/15]